MSRPVPPCGRACPRRRPGCHDGKVCPAWTAYQEALAAYHKDVRQSRRSFDDYLSVRNRTLYQLKRRKGDKDASAREI